MIVVDDASPDGTASRLACDYPDVTVLRGSGDLWWTGATNLGVRHALRRGFDYVLTINNDTCVRPDFLGYLVDMARRHAPCIVGSRIHFLDEPAKVWAAGGYASWGGADLLSLHRRPAGDGPEEVELLTGCGTLVPAACYRKIGLYDSHNFPHYHADAEFTLRASRRGYRILVEPRSLVLLDEGTPSRPRSVFRRWSPTYWRPLLAMHLRYCPRRLLWLSLRRQFAHHLRQFWAKVRNAPSPQR
jgi:GT2 family glycosyltransferase